MDYSKAEPFPTLLFCKTATVLPSSHSFGKYLSIYDLLGMGKRSSVYTKNTVLAPTELKISWIWLYHEH